MGALTVGVEEEFQLLDRATGRLVSAADPVLAGAEPTAPGELMGELPLSQVETATPVCTTLDEVDRELRRLRAVAQRAAEAQGCWVVGSGTPPAGDWAEQSVSSDPRYAAIAADKAYLVSQQLISGMHVHVGVPSPDLGITVLNATRPWLAVLAAITANSPYWLGTDTGFASYRTVHWGRWPVSGPPPAFRDRADYDTTVAELTAVGAVTGPSNVYWDVRPSSKYATVELRVMDTCQTVDDAVLVTALIRAIAATALAAPGESPVDPPLPLLRAASWRAARFGLGDRLVRPGTARLAPAGDVVAALVAAVRPALEEAGDAERVDEGLVRLQRLGTGADRQRAAFARGGPPALAAMLGAALLA